MTTGIKKLYFYRHDVNEIVIDIYDAQEWEDFLIIKVGNSSSPVSQEMIDQVSGIIEQLDTGKYAQVIVMPADIELDFYGVAEEDE